MREPFSMRLSYARVSRNQKPKRLQSSICAMAQPAGRYARSVAVYEQRSSSEIYRRALTAMGHVVTGDEAEALFLDEIGRA